MRTYLTHPSIYGKRISFVSQGDLYVMNLETAEIRCLVKNFGVVAENRFSPDGKCLFFRLIRGSDPVVSEIYSIKIDTGETRQHTNFGASVTLISGFTRDGDLIVGTNAFTFNRGYTELYVVDKNGNFSNMGYGPATDFFQEGELTFIGRNTRELQHWKHYQGGTHGVIWSADRSSGPFRVLIDNGFNINSPFLMDGRIYFSSDHEGSGAIYSIGLDGSGERRHTNPGEFYHRNPSGDGGNVVFQSGADLFIIRKDSSGPELLDIPLEIDRSKLAPRSFDPLEYAESVNIDETGENLQMIIRGTGKILNVRRGPVTTLMLEEGRIKLLSGLGRESVVAVHTGTGEDSISEFDQHGSVLKNYSGDWGIIVDLKPSTDGQHIAFANNRNELLLLRRKDSLCRSVSAGTNGRISDISWHPSGQYIAYTYHNSESSTQIRIYGIREEKEFIITSYGYKDSNPVFDPSGHFLAYISQRELDPVYDKISFQLGYPIASRPYLVTLSENSQSPFTGGYFSEEDKLDKIDFDGIMGRSIRVPVDIADYQKLGFGKDALFFLKFPVEGASKYYLDSKKEKESGILQSFDLRENRLKDVVSGISDFEISGNSEKILLLGSDGIYVAKSTATDIDLDSFNSEDLTELEESRLSARTSPEVELRGMFRESWVLMREHYWDRAKAGEFWSSVYKRYLPLLDRVGCRQDLSDLIRSMIGEMGSSHCYEFGGELTDATAEVPGRIGADFRVEGESVYVSDILIGDPTNADEKSPLLYPGVGVKPGDRIVEVDSRKVSTLFELFDALSGTAEKTVLVRTSREGSEAIFPVTPLSDEKHLRYRSWVERNRKYVHEKSRGRVGYIHIPDMGPSGYNEFFRLLYSETRYESLIVDVRYNGGGHVSELLLEKLNRKRLGFDQPRDGQKIPYPSYSVTGNIVALTNEYAGSDGDIFSHSFKLMGLGRLVGKRTWGGVFGFESYITLVDGTELAQPGFAFSFMDVGQSVENYGTDPDIQVDITPDDFLNGRDPQLDRSIAEAMKPS